MSFRARPAGVMRLTVNPTSATYDWQPRKRRRFRRWLSRLLRRYFDARAEREALRLLATDAAVINDWRIAVAENIKARRSRWADVAYLKRQRARSYAA